MASSFSLIPPAKIFQELSFAEEQIQSSDALIVMSQGQWEGCLRSDIYTPKMVSLIDKTQPDFSPALGESLRQVVFGKDELAYQIGEITEILSQGHLCATPHSVQAPKGEAFLGVERSTFALFMQPDWDEFLKFPAEIHHHKELIPPNGTLTFGEYSEALLHKYYHRKL